MDVRLTKEINNNAGYPPDFLKEHPSTYRLRLIFLLPLATLLVVLAATFVYLVYKHEHKDVDENIVTARQLTNDMFREEIRQETNLLSSLMMAIRLDTELCTALTKKDRDLLLRHSASLFARLREEFGVTHFYFTGPDRVNILRVHQPNRYGDEINRYTTLEAERTGKMSSGLELGPLGTFTLRLVSPLYSDGKDHRLLGYIELGKEIDEILQRIQKFVGKKLFVKIYKKYLDRDKWEVGMRMLNRIPKWDDFPDTVIVESTEMIPARLAGILMTNATLPQDVPLDIPNGDKTYIAVYNVPQKLDSMLR